MKIIKNTSGYETRAMRAVIVLATSSFAIAKGGRRRSGRQCAY
jgi:hypothetical protein